MPSLSSSPHYTPELRSLSWLYCVRGCRNLLNCVKVRRVESINVPGTGQAGASFGPRSLNLAIASLLVPGVCVMRCPLFCVHMTTTHVVQAKLVFIPDVRVANAHYFTCTSGQLPGFITYRHMYDESLCHDAVSPIDRAVKCQTAKDD